MDREVRVVSPFCQLLANPKHEPTIGMIGVFTGLLLMFFHTSILRWKGYQ
jgi:hypothetical protein